VVRGMCSLRPGLPEVSETIRVSSVIGRFLEHSRLFWFANGGDEEMYIGSADWMGRNLDRRVEAVVPIEEPKLHSRLLRLIDLYLQDNCTAWDMQADGSFQRRIPEEENRAVQATLIQHWRHGLSDGEETP
jgi:polyphosphate kinase